MAKNIKANVSVSLRIHRIIQTPFCLPVSLSAWSNGPWMIGYPAPFKIISSWWFLRTFCHSHQNFWNLFLAWGKYAQNSLPMCPCFPASTIPLVRSALRCLSSGLLVSEECKGVGLTTPPFPVGSARTFCQPCWCSVDKHSYLPVREEVMALNKDIRLLLFWCQVHCFLSH